MLAQIEQVKYPRSGIIAGMFVRECVRVGRCACNHASGSQGHSLHCSVVGSSEGVSIENISELLCGLTHCLQIEHNSCGNETESWILCANRKSLR